MESLSAQGVRDLFREFSRIMDEEKQHLLELDGAVGDGDLGLTMSKGFRAAAEELEKSPGEDAGKLLLLAGMTIARTAPSTMGTLLATGFMRGGKRVSGATVLELSGLADFLDAFTEGIMERGKAKPGEKTIIDALDPARKALRGALVAGGVSLPEALRGARGAAEEGLEATKNMQARHGRVAYYGEKSIGIQDPGATVGVLILRGLEAFVA